MQGNRPADLFIESLVRLIERWGLVTPVIAFLEANKPLSFVTSQALLMAQPVADLFIAREWTTDLAVLLADREQLEMLIARLASAKDSRAMDR
jgi:hypothetical protein